MNYRRILSSIALIIGAFVFSIGLQAFAAFSPPTAAPPNADAYAPLNTGPGTQTKTGDICTTAGGGKCLSTAGGVGPGGTGDGSTPTGAIMFFNSATCPAGWSEVTAARGRYLVGWDSTKGISSLGFSVGIALNDKEDRSTGQHLHAQFDPGHSHGGIPVIGYVSDNRGGGGAEYGQVGWTATSPAITGFAVGGVDGGAIAGTNAPYLQLLVCQNGGSLPPVVSGVTLYNGLHSSGQCISRGGNLVSDGVGNSFCKFSGASCPAGWSPYGNWTQTSQNTSYYNSWTPASYACNTTAQSCSATNTACNSGQHGFANTAPESVTCSSQVTGSYTYTAPGYCRASYQTYVYVCTGGYCGYGACCGYQLQDVCYDYVPENPNACAAYTCGPSSTSVGATVTYRGCY